MATNRLDIVYHIDTGQADQQAAAFNQRQADREKKALSDTEVAEKAKAKAVEQSNQARIAAAAKALAEEEGKISRILTKEQVAEKAKEALEDRLNSKRIALATAQMQAQDRAYQATIKGLDKQISKFSDQNKVVGEGVAAIGRFGASLAGLQGLQGTVAAFADHFDRIRQAAFKASEDVMKMRGAVRELQALRGEMGQTGKGVSHVFDIARETLQKPEEVTAMESAGLGIGDLALKTPEDKQQFTEAMKASGKLQMLEGGDAGAYGQMMGQLALNSKGPIDARDLEAKAERLFRIQQPGGFKTMSQAMSQYSKVNALIQNGVYTPEQAMGLLAMFSVGSPDEASTKLEQFTRTAVMGKDRARKTKMADDIDPVLQSQYFKNIGIQKQDDPIEVSSKIIADLKGQIGKSQARGEKFDMPSYLYEHGMGNQQELFATMDIAGLDISGKAEKIKEAAASGLQYGEHGKGVITEKFAERAARDPAIGRRMAENSEKAAETVEGKEGEDVAAIQQAAFARLRGRKELFGNWDSFKEFQGSTMFNPRNFLGGDRSKVELESQAMLTHEAHGVGVDFSPPRRVDAKTGAETTEYVGDERIKELMLQIRQAGGNPLASAPGDIQRAADKLLKSAEALERVLKPNGPSPAFRGTPVVQATR